MTWYHNSSPMSVTIAMAKSTSGVTAAESGIRRRGKYTFEMSCWLPTTDPAPLATAVEKYVHGTRPA